MQDMSIWCDPEKKLISFYNKKHVCLDIFFEEGTLKLELYDGDSLIGNGNIGKVEIPEEDVVSVLKDKSLKSILEK